jgi:hypothetical protein
MADTYTPEIAEKICAEIVDGRSIRSICQDEGMPAKRTVMYWLGRHPDFRAMYEAARLIQADLIFDEILEIADDGTNDFVEREVESGRKVKTFDNEHFGRSRLRVDARKWVLCKMIPKKYGDYLKQDVEVSGQLDLVARLAEGRRRVAELQEADDASGA